MSPESYWALNESLWILVELLKLVDLLRFLRRPIAVISPAAPSLLLNHGIPRRVRLKDLLLMHLYRDNEGGLP